MIIRAFAFLVVSALFALSTAIPARADDLPQEQTERVAATVNLDAITVYDLDARVLLALLSARLPDSPEARQRIEPEVLRRLVDEHLELQEATRLKIDVTDSEIGAGISDLEKQNKMEKGQLATFLEGKGIDPQTLRDQIHAQLAWVRVVRQELSPEVRIGDEEIDARLAELKRGQNRPSYLAADIYLAAEDPRRDGEVHQLADNLAQQLAAGAPFVALARQFSQAGAATGGDLGWISRGMIDDTLFDALIKLEPGHASQPIRTRDGYHILLLRDKHDAGQVLSTEPTLDLAQVDLTMLPSASDEEHKQAIASFRRAVAKDRACDDYERHARTVATARYARLGLVRPSETPAEVQSMIVALAKGQMSEPIKLDNIDRFLIVCDRTEATNGLPSREEVRRRIENERLELLASRYLRDLRRAAFVEIRL